jgi:hypothetical protein
MNSKGQFVIKGKVVNEKNFPVSGANVFIQNTLDGCSSDSLGIFKLVTTEKGPHFIVASEVGFEETITQIFINADTNGVIIKMRSAYRQLNDVVISAGSFSVGDNNKTILKPMDIMTTAGANADVMKAIETLPGAQQAGASTGLFVRGGDASETSVIIDEMIVQNAFFSNLPGVSQSGRFAPFQFKGISFSSGGYSARYGQALSSVLELSTQDLPEKSRISLGANMTGVFGSMDKVWKRNSLGISASYNNADIFYGLANTNIKFYDPPGGDGFSIKYINEPNKNEIFKAVVRYSKYIAGLKTPDPFIAGDTTDFDITNYTFYSNASYQKQFNNKFLIYSSASYSYNRDNIKWSVPVLGNIAYLNKDYRIQFREEAKKYLLSNLSALGGIEFQHYGYTKIFDTLNGSFAETIAAIYAEATWSPFKWFSLRPGIRYEQSKLLNQHVLEPRISMAMKTGKYSQIAFASGLFYQDPANIYLFSGYKPSLQEAVHYIIDYQWVRSDRTFRIEAYYKKYLSLVKEYDSAYDPNGYRFITAGTKVDNSGYGYAKGAEVFWHDKKTIHGLDYWISYSYIDTKRLYENYLSSATPDFVSTHNLNLVTKYFLDAWQTSFSITYTYASGRQYYNPSGNGFLSDRTPAYQNLALSIGRLMTIKKWFTVIYAGIDNVTDRHNIFGYRYSSDATKKYPVLPALYRSVIIGMNISLSQFDKSEL